MGYTSPNLRAVLREVSIGARQLFFCTISGGPGQGHWCGMPYGIDEEKATTELISVGLGRLDDDPALVLSTYRRDELLGALSGYPTKKGWSKKYCIKFLIKNAPEVHSKLLEGKRIFVLNAEFHEEGNRLLNWVKQITKPLALIIGFMK